MNAAPWMKLVGEREALGIQVKNNFCRCIPVLLFIVFFVGCSSAHRATNKNTSQLKASSIVEDTFDYDYYFLEGTKQKLLGNYNDAILLLNSALMINKFSAASYFQLSQIYFTTRNIAKALNYGRLAVRYDDTNSVYELNLARLYHDVCKIDSSLLLYKQISTVNP
ncbi:MAG: hypothetical protein Q8928_01575 [Bacteroidota bacterium]|nr:hypothetical protein [Bacteroidota bacterium]